jgi:hypothetical protein
MGWLTVLKLTLKRGTVPIIGMSTKHKQTDNKHQKPRSNCYQHFQTIPAVNTSHLPNHPDTKMTTNTPVLAVACGPNITTWDIAKSTISQETNSFDAKSLVGKGTGVEQFQPHGDDDVSCLAWNHNGQGMLRCIVGS